jgi:hypothetical protein
MARLALEQDAESMLNTEETEDAEERHVPYWTWGYDFTREQENKRLTLDPYLKKTS